MKVVRFNNDKYTLPSKWDELNPKQLIAVAKIMLAEQHWDNIKVRLVLYFLGMRVIRRRKVIVDEVEHFYVKHGLRRVYLLSVFDIAALGNTLEFLTEKPDKEGNRLLRPKIRKQPFPILKFRFKRFAGYENALTDMLFGEFIFAETYYYRYLTTKDEVWLNRLLAVLYRRVKGGAKQEFSEELVEHYAKVMAAIPIYRKLVIRFYYDGCKEFLARKFPNTLGGGEGGKGSDPFEDFHKVTVAMASGDPTKAEGVRNSLLYDALESFEQTSKTNSRMKSLMTH